MTQPIGAVGGSLTTDKSGQIDTGDDPVHVLCMASKTISLSVESYNRLKAARIHPGESFSSVVGRARWDEAAPLSDGRRILEYYRELDVSGGTPYLDDETLDAMDSRANQGQTIRAEADWDK